MDNQVHLRMQFKNAITFDQTFRSRIHVHTHKEKISLDMRISIKNNLRQVEL